MFPHHDSPHHNVVSSANHPCGKHARRSKAKIPRDISTKALHFPTYDKCDSLLSFPTKFASCLNSGDFTSMSRLIKSRIEKNCEMHLFGACVDVETLVRVFELLDELHPDSVNYVHNTKASNNLITSSIYFKYTAAKVILESMKKSVPDPANLKLCPEPQSDPKSLHQYIDSKPAEDRLALLTLVYTAEELVVRGRAILNLTIDDYSKKITCLSITCQFSSFDAVSV